MEYYSVDPLIFHTVSPDPFVDFPCAYLKRIQVLERSKLRTTVDLGTKYLRQGHVIIFSAAGRDCSKAVTCAEILKTNFRTIHQITITNQSTTTEVFTPLIPKLDAIEVRRTVPVIHILLSRGPIDESTPGYQYQKNLKRPKKVLSLRELEEAENTCEVSA